MTSAERAGTRRDFLKNTGRIAAATALAGVVAPAVHAAEDNTIRVALIGCGSRGTGAARNALSVKNGPSSSWPRPTSSRTTSNGASAA